MGNPPFEDVSPIKNGGFPYAFHYQRVGIPMVFSRWSDLVCDDFNGGAKVKQQRYSDQVIGHIIAKKRSLHKNQQIKFPRVNTSFIGVYGLIEIKLKNYPETI